MNDDMLRKQLRSEIERYVKDHPGCVQGDVVKRLFPKYEKAFERTAVPIGNMRSHTQSYLSKLVRDGKVDVGKHPTKTNKRRPVKTYTWRDDDGGN